MKTFRDLHLLWGLRCRVWDLNVGFGCRAYLSTLFGPSPEELSKSTLKARALGVGPEYTTPIPKP